MPGEAQAAVLRKQIESYGDPRLYAVSLVAKHLAASRQPLVPEQLFMTGGTGGGSGPETTPLGILCELLVAEKVGFQLTGELRVES